MDPENDGSFSWDLDLFKSANSLANQKMVNAVANWLRQNQSESAARYVL